MAKITIRQTKLTDRANPLKVLTRFDWSDGKKDLHVDYIDKLDRDPALNLLIDTVAKYTENYKNLYTTNEFNNVIGIKSELIEVHV